MDKIKNQLGQIVTLIGLVGAIGAGFIKYGEVMERLNSMSAPNLSPITKEVNSLSTKIAVMDKEIKFLRLEIKEIKIANKNPLMKWDMSISYGPLLINKEKKL